MTDALGPFDYVIAGGGSAACLIAARLIENGHSVCLIEAGPERSDFNLRMPAGWLRSLDDPSRTWRHQTQPGPAIDGRSILVRQGRVTGGTGTMNGLVYVRGQAADYDGWRDRGLPGWGWDDVRPYFEKAEDYQGFHSGIRGRSGEMGVTDNDWTSEAGDKFIASANRVGIRSNESPNGGEDEGVGYYERMISAGWRSCGTYVTFLQRHRRSPNLTLLSEHIVDKVDIERGRATGVTVRTSRDAPPLKIPARVEVILASSTFGNPGILMRSGIGPEAALAEIGVAPLQVLEGVGRNAGPFLHPADCPHQRSPDIERAEPWSSPVDAGSTLVAGQALDCGDKPSSHLCISARSAHLFPRGCHHLFHPRHSRRRRERACQGSRPDLWHLSTST